MKKHLRLGTRKSLLAITQSQWVAQEIIKKNPNIFVELVGIETKGDKILDIPLSKMEGKEFFIKELDDALMEKKVDFNVHSLKDLSLERPDCFFSGIYPKRALSNDVLILHNEGLKKIRKNIKIKIGTSAPRRLENTPIFLNEIFLSHLDHPKEYYEFIEIRGNINTRISRLHLEESNEKKLDGVILAAAGLCRVYDSEIANPDIIPLLKNTHAFILPLSTCPPAPGQGALALECLKEDLETQKILFTIHDSQTDKNIQKERRTLKEYGGGCHQKFGASATDHPTLGLFFIVKGQTSDHKPIDRVEFQTPLIDKKTFQNAKVFDGSIWTSEKTALPYSTDALKNNSPLFIAHAHALDNGVIPYLKNKSIWVSGNESWKKLNKKGITIQGSLEGLGMTKLQEYIRASFLSLPPLKEWVILTNKEAENSWKEGTVIATYSSRFSLNSTVEAHIKNSNIFYWQSPEQYLKCEHILPSSAIHFCGAGKTYDFLSQKKLSSLYPFPHSLLWKKWIKDLGVSL